LFKFGRGQSEATPIFPVEEHTSVNNLHVRQEHSAVDTLLF
jgi:hypothetical protein